MSRKPDGSECSMCGKSTLGGDGTAMKCVRTGEIICWKCVYKHLIFEEEVPQVCGQEFENQ